MEIKLSLGQIHSPIKQRSVGGFRLSESEYSPQLKTPMHSHQRVCFSLVLSGASVQTVGRKTRLRTAGTMLFYSLGDSHCESFGNTSSRIFSIELSPEWLERFREYPSLRQESAMFEGGLLGWLTSRLYREFYNNDEAATFAIEGLSLEIMAEACRRKREGLSRKPSAALIRARDLIHSRLCEHLSLSDVATQVGVHPVYLASAFRKTYGCTVGEYLRKHRIELAITKLTTSDAPLAFIAVDVGFANQAHFTKVFKEHTGVTPGQYRLTIRS